MFFDDPIPDEMYKKLLVDVAMKQRELLLHHFNWKKRQSNDLEKKKSFFRKKEAQDVVYERYVDELEILKEKLTDHCRREGYASGMFWWKVSWEQVEPYLICDLNELKDRGNWRFARSWNAVCEDGIYTLVLREEGHYSGFSSHDTYEYREESRYDAGERAEMVRNFNKKMTQYALDDIMLHDDSPVRSIESGTIYASREDYYESLEYLTDKKFYSDVYERNLYTVHETTGIEAVSRGRGYDSFFVVGHYHITDDGMLDYVSTNGFQLYKISGDVPEGILERYANRDAMIVCAAYMADCAKVKSVPLRLFGKDITESAKDYDEALCQSKIYTCLAEKLWTGM